MKKELNPIALWSVVAVVAVAVVLVGVKALDVPLGPQPEVEPPAAFTPPAGYVTPGQGGQPGPIGAPKEPPKDN